MSIVDKALLMGIAGLSAFLAMLGMVWLWRHRGAAARAQHQKDTLNPT